MNEPTWALAAMNDTTWTPIEYDWDSRELRARSKRPGQGALARLTCQVCGTSTQKLKRYYQVGA